MTSQHASKRHERLMALFDEACDLDAEARAAFIERLRDDERDLATELSALLQHDRLASDTLEACVVPPSLHFSGMTDFMNGSMSFDDRASATNGDVGPLIPGVPDLEVVATLAEGGMGRVLLAHQRSLNRQVAMKVLRRHAMNKRGPQSLFEEARLAGSLEHPNIVPVHFVAEDRDGLPVLVMKRIEGVSWRVLLDEPNHDVWVHLLHDGTDRLSVHLSILGSVCHAIHYAHTRGVIHCDIKPDNIMVGAFGEVYVVDWGIARRLSTSAPAPPLGSGPYKAGKMVGTPGFMAPEMVRGPLMELDARTDVYLLGATLHYVLTGELRHTGRTAADQWLNAAESRPCSHGPDVPADLAQICTRATAADPAERFPNAEAFRQAIAQYIRNRGSSELSDAAWNRLEKLPSLSVQSAQEGQVDEILTECQFAFHQSLRTWPENPRARVGLRACLSAMVEHEISRENIGRAKALLQQIEKPDAALSTNVSNLETRLLERDANAARFVDVERSRDWSTQARARAFYFVTAIAVAFGIWRYAVRDQSTNPHTIPPAFLAVYMGSGFVVLGVFAVISWRRVFVSDVSRRLVLGLLCAIGFQFVSRVLHMFPAPSTASIVSADQVVSAAVSAMGAITFARWLWFFVPIFLAGALLARLFPLHAGNLFAMTTLFCGAVGLYTTWPRDSKDLLRR